MGRGDFGVRGGGVVWVGGFGFYFLFFDLLVNKIFFGQKM